MVLRLSKGTIFVAIVIYLSLFCPPLLRAQYTAEVIGTVVDSTGAVIVDGTVTLTNVGTGVTKTTKTTSKGDYSFVAMQVGTYMVKVEVQGFNAFTAQVTVASGDRARVDATLHVGNVVQVTEVTGVAPALHTDSATLSSLLTDTAVQDLPLNGRNVIKLVQLLPGVNEGWTGSIVEGNRPDDRRPVSGFSANGQGSVLNLQLLDGFDNNDRIIGAIGVRPSMDAIQEVNVSTNLYSAEYSRSAGGIMNVISKSGTNGFHGSAYEFLRNKVLNADPNYFNRSVPNPPFRQNQYGASVGGPIKKDKTFFFVDFENFRQALGLSLSETVPTLHEEQNPGDFSDIGGPVLSPSQITPLGLAFFKMFPAPNQTAGNAGTPGFMTSQDTAPVSNYGYSPQRTQSTTAADLRIDHHFGNNDSLYGRYSINDSNTMTPSGFPDTTINGVKFNPGVGACYSCPDAFPGPSLERQQQFGLSYTHVISPTLLVNLRFGYLRSAIQSFGVNSGPVATQLGFPCNSASCINVPGVVAASGIPSIFFANSPYQNIGDSLWVPLLEFNNAFQYEGMLGWNKGAHSFKIGLGLIRRQALISQSGNGALQDGARGRFDFGGQYTGYALGDLLEGLSGTDMRAEELSAPNRRVWEPHAYVQDDWRVTRKLTLNLGLRYDIYTPYTEVRGRITNFDPTTGLIISPSLLGSQQSSKTAGIRTDLLDFAPRAGFAWSLPHKVVLRGGFGLTYFPNNYESQFNQQNAPIQFNTQCGLMALSTYGACGGQFASSAVATNYLPSTQPQAQTGGALLAAGVPYPYLDPTTVTNKANYAGTSINAEPFNYPAGRLEQMNITMEKDFAGNVLSVGYVQEIGTHSVIGEQGMGEVISQPANYLAPNPLVAAGFPWLANTSVYEAGPYGHSDYKALQVSFQRRFKRGLAFSFGYTYAHDDSTLDQTQYLGSNCYPSKVNGTSYPCLFDNVKDPSQPFQFTNLDQFDYGNANIDIRNHISYTIDYNLPFGKSLKGVEGQLVKGWEVNVAGFWQTGFPFTVINSVPQNGIPGVNDMPDMTCSGIMPHPTPAQWVNPACFQVQTPGTFGYQLPNMLFGPHQRSVDFSVFKDFPIKEQIKLQFRAEVFNLTNTPNFDNPSDSGHNTLGVPGFGSITSINIAAAPRQVQFALKLLF